VLTIFTSRHSAACYGCTPSKANNNTPKSARRTLNKKKKSVAFDESTLIKTPTRGRSSKRYNRTPLRNLMQRADAIDVEDSSPLQLDEFEL